MPRPQSKTELLRLSEENFRLLNDIINEVRQDSFPPGTMNRNIRDVLAHLYHWHWMFLDWYETGMRGERPFMPAKGFTWKDTPALNRWIWEQYQNTNLEEVKSKLMESHAKTVEIIATHSEEELFEKKRYQWTGSTSLASYLISATSSHYDWAIKLIKKATKSAS